MSTTVQMRPTFSLETKLSAENTMRCIKESFSREPDTDSDGDPTSIYRGQFVGNHAMISIVESERHFWSPWMHLDIRETDSGRHVFARFSPHPSIWTGIMFAYLAIAAIVCFAVMFGISQQISGESPWAYYLIPVGLIIAAILWFAAKAGQNLAREQMQQMKTRIEECVTTQNAKKRSDQHPE